MAQINEYVSGGVTYTVTDTEDTKECVASDGSFISKFEKSTGSFERTAAEGQPDPTWLPAGPELLDIEVVTNGCPNRCAHCYKGNTDKEPTNMSFETFVRIFQGMPKTLTQVAFGITGLHSNPDFMKMLHFVNDSGVSSNFTMSGVDYRPEDGPELAEVSGCICVSVYEDTKELAYTCVRSLLDCGVTQVNLHVLVSVETLPLIRTVLRDVIMDPRLNGITAVTLLSLKPKGRAAGSYTILSSDQFDELFDWCSGLQALFGKVIGMDSCSAPQYARWLRKQGYDEELYNEAMEYNESCESGLFSAYINVRGEFYPCSFCEGVPTWETGIPVLGMKDFSSVWHHQRVQDWRDKLIDSTGGATRKCLAYQEINP